MVRFYLNADCHNLKFNFHSLLTKNTLSSNRAFLIFIYLPFSIFTSCTLPEFPSIIQRLGATVEKLNG